jgi:hypothetical protein
VAVEETYGDVTYNGHAKKGEEFRNNMTNFGILMEIKGIEDPFTWSRDVVQKCQSGLLIQIPIEILLDYTIHHQENHLLHLKVILYQLLQLV